MFFNSSCSNAKKLGLYQSKVTSSLAAFKGQVTEQLTTVKWYRGIFADVIVYIFAHLHRAFRTERKMLDINWLQAAKELVEFNTCWNV